MAEEILEEMEEGEGRGMNTIMGILLLLIVLIGGYLFFENRITSEEIEVTQEETAEVTGPTIPEEYSIYAEAVEANDFVSINTFLVESGFAVVYDSVAGEPGNILGFSDLLTSGVYHEILVSINRSLNAGEVVFVLLHIDDGDAQFTSGNDYVAVGSGGNIILTVFVVERIEEILEEPIL